MNLRQALEEVLQQGKDAKYVLFEEDPMYTKRESELLQQYMKEHGRMPGGGADELDDLFIGSGAVTKAFEEWRINKRKDKG